LGFGEKGTRGGRKKSSCGLAWMKSQAKRTVTGIKKKKNTGRRGGWYWEGITSKESKLLSLAQPPQKKKIRKEIPGLGRGLKACVDAMMVGEGYESGTKMKSTKRKYGVVGSGENRSEKTGMKPL